MIYFDNAATSLIKPDSVIDAVTQAMKTMGNSSRGTHGAAMNSMHVVFDTRKLLADFFGLGIPEQAAFTSNSTEALNIAIRGLFEPGDHVITTAMEHNSVLRPLYLLEKEGIISLTILPADKKGCICLKELEASIKNDTKGIVITHASNLTGNMNDLDAVGELAHKYGLLLIVDASQTAGIFPIDMKKQHISALCVTGHKSILGPQGIGALLVDPCVKIRPFKVGGSGIHSFSKSQPDTMPTALEAGTLNGPGIAGLKAALLWHLDHPMEELRKKELLLMNTFREGIMDIPEIKIYGDFEAENRAPIVSFNLADYPSSMVSDELSYRFDIATRAGAHCAPLMHEALGTVDQGAVRFSFSHFNTMEEVEQAVKAVHILATEE